MKERRKFGRGRLYPLEGLVSRTADQVASTDQEKGMLTRTLMEMTVFPTGLFLILGIETPIVPK